MSDFLLENENARKLVKTLGLPIPVPEKLARAKGPYEERPLDDKKVLVCGVGELQSVLAQSLTKAGAYPWVDRHLRGCHRAVCGTGRSLGAGPQLVAPGEAPEGERIDAIVFDGTGLETPDDLQQLYEFIHPWIRRLNPSGRVVVIGRPAADAKKPAHAATRAGLEGFTRSLAKEIGGNGSIANSVFVQRGRRGATRRGASLSPVSAVGVHQLPAVSRHDPRPGRTRRPTRTCSAARSRSSPARRGESAKPRPSFSPRRARTWFVSTGPPTTRRAARWRSASAARRFSSTSPTWMRRSRIAAELKERFRRRGHRRAQRRCDARQDPRAHEARRLGHGGRHQPRRRHPHHRSTSPRRGAARRADGSFASLRSQESPETAAKRTIRRAKRASSASSKALAAKVAKKGITVNAIAPGFIETRLTNAMPVAIREVARRMSAVGQGGTPEDVGQAITFLATPGAVGLTGETVRVCGGALVGA